jgi:hypothetical protein
MPPRRRQQFTQESIDQQLQQIHLLDPSSSSENLEQLGPIIKQIHSNRQQEGFLRTVQGLIEAKDAEIEKICGDNYQDFISSVQTLFTVKSYTDRMKENITSLDTSVSQLGRGLVEKKRSLLQHKKTAANLDEAIDTLQACLRILDVVDRVGEMVKEGKYWSALRVCRSHRAHVYSLCVTIHRSFFSVSRRYSEHATDFTVTHTILSTSAFLPPIFTSTDKRCCDCFHEAVAPRDPECEHGSWPIGR